MTFWTNAMMMAGKKKPFAFKSAGTLATAATGTTQTFNVDMPDDVAIGDTLVMVLTGSSAGISDARESVPAGWARLFFYTNDTPGALAAYIKTADGTEGASQAVTFYGTQAPTKGGGGVILCYQGGAGTAVAGTTVYQSSNASGVIPALSGLSPGIALAIMTLQAGGETIGGTIPTGWALRFAGYNATSFGSWSLNIYEHAPSPGPTLASATFVWSDTGPKMTNSIQINE